jgi:N-methylhydantoinase A
MLLGVDVGGTFTDAVLVEEDGGTHTAKVPSTPREQQRGVLAAVRAVLERAGAGPEQVRRFAHGMTVATNALLEATPERPPSRTALVATEGFTDVVELARQARPSLYELCAAPPRPLAPAQLRFGAPERTGPSGVLRELDARATDAMIERLAAAQPQAVAVVLLHSYAHPQHERRVGELIEARLPNAHVSLSHELVGTFREYERAATTELDAALSPLLAAYLGTLGEQARALGLPDVQVMQSSGGLTSAHRAARHAALTVLSGPAGGVGGALLLSEAAGTPKGTSHDGGRAGEGNALCFDMGGTSCDVCLIEHGRVVETTSRTVAGRPLALAALDIHTVGAGGGSIAWRDPGGALRVGPESAGAEPGPACYGRGGTRATVTDANLVLGRLLATPLSVSPDATTDDSAPPRDGLWLDREAAEHAVAALARELSLDTLACAEGIVRVAETEMRRALASVTVQRGIDPRKLALLPFGGAGPLHAAAMASELGIERVLCPRACGVLSALGLAAAAPRRDASSTTMLSGNTFTRERIEHELGALIERASAELDAPPAQIGVRYELRYAGQAFELSVDEHIDPAIFLGEGHVHSSNTPEVDSHGLREPAALRTAFETEHEQRYGYRDDEAEVELVNVRVSVLGPRPALRLEGSSAAPATLASTRIVFDGKWTEAQLWRGELPAGARVQGPALCAMPQSTLLVPPGWSGTVDERGTVVLEHSAREAQSA